MRHYNTDNELLRFSTKNNAEVKDLFLSPLIGCGVATPRQFLFSPQKSDITMQTENQQTENQQTEVWKDVNGFEALYEVSNLGNVRTKYREYYAKTKGGVTQKRHSKQRLKVKNLSNTGYYTVALVSENKTYNTLLHRIIATAFVPNPNPEIFKVVNHINGIKTDNRIENLEWCSSSDNNIHALDNKLRKPIKTLLTKELIYKIDELRESNFTYKEIAEKLNISHFLVGKYLRGKNFKYQDFKS